VILKDISRVKATATSRITVGNSKERISNNRKRERFLKLDGILLHPRISGYHRHLDSERG
jgi:hypothetical protein